jgi:hydrogenase nickel incorporation protein HypA/HybF
MHELSIAQSLIELTSDYGRRHGASAVTYIHVRLGVLCGLMRPLYFCFDAAARGTPCEGAILEIEEVAVTLRCPGCHAVTEPRSLYCFRCADCGTPTRDVVTGREMEIGTIELRKPSDPQPFSSPKQVDALNDQYRE